MSAANKRTSPDYLALVKFLVTPFLESPDTLKVDCEQFNNHQRVWLRLAFKAEDRGKVYGRGGRNIQAIRTLLQTSATLAGQSLNLEIHEDKSSPRTVDAQGAVSLREGEKFSKRPSSPRRSPPSNKYSLS